jgi:large subunit ribosomal protein L36e
MTKGEPKGIAVGLNKGHVLTKIKKTPKTQRPSYRKGRLGKRVDLVRHVIREVCGMAPYEKRILEYLKTGTAKDSKKALKLAKRRLGTQRRALRKKEELENVLRQQRKK